MNGRFSRTERPCFFAARSKALGNCNGALGFVEAEDTSGDASPRGLIL